jgi:hypothetical protein
MSEQPETEPIQPTAIDFEAASLEWAKQHGKTKEQMQHLTDEETAECYLLAQTYALVRLGKAENKA